MYDLNKLQTQQKMLVADSCFQKKRFGIHYTKNLTHLTTKVYDWVPMYIMIYFFALSIDIVYTILVYKFEFVDETFYTKNT